MAAAVAATVLIAIFLGPRLRSPQQAAADAAPPPPSQVTATVERRPLSEPLTLRGSVVPGPSVKVVPPVDAIGPDSVVTRVAVHPGDVVRNGTLLAEQAGQPIFGLVLPFRLYRDIAPAMSGPDVREVQKALRKLGYLTPVSGAFDAPTQTALRKFFKAGGYELQPDTADAATSAPVPTAAGDSPKASSAPQVTLKRATIVRLSESGQKVTAVHVKVGDVLTAESVLVELNGKAPFLRVMVAQDKVQLLKKGQTGTVTDEGSTDSATAVIVTVSDKAKTDSVTGALGFAVDLQFRGRVLIAEDRTFRVDINPSGNVKAVLAAPVSALYARADGTTFVLLPTADAKPASEVTVVAGQQAGGWVEIASSVDDKVTEGTVVVVGQQ
ncbi:peptidoglycan-binding protein [Actinoplanes siamensis]|uniref:Peptidoglycan-binding protein n=2 Tax=Actinoplanes siamensis TaxID=1223317 RepID=A0A919MWT5_9ACTN|nr:peptidoglycan-binding protein [Actinoplanes siamensis]